MIDTNADWGRGGGNKWILDIFWKNWVMITDLEVQQGVKSLAVNNWCLSSYFKAIE